MAGPSFLPAVAARRRPRPLCGGLQGSECQCSEPLPAALGTGGVFGKGHRVAAGCGALGMTCEAERHPLGVFECQLCALTAPYSSMGQKPPDTQSVILLEESYIMKDPFTPDKDRFLILGSR
ncbi:cysteine-rich DPF motif domain-containing protein 1-like isoform X2 [Saccopteryx leptura]